MKKIVFVDETAQIGGAEINLLQILPLLVQSGWEPVVLLPNDGPLVDKLNTLGISYKVVHGGPFYSVSSYVGNQKIPNFLAWFLTFINGMRWSLALQRELRLIAPQAVQTVSLLAHIFGGWAAQQAGLPLVAHVQDIVECGSGFGIYTRIFQSWAAHIPSRLVCISPLVARQFRENASAVSKVLLIWNMIDSKKFFPTESPSQKDEIRIGTVARLTRWKGQHIALQVAALLNSKRVNFQWAFLGTTALGDEDYARELQKIIKSSQLEQSVRFLGWVEDTSDFYRNLDILVHLPTEPEPFGLVIGEALSCGLPVITSHGGLDDIVVEAGGLLVSTDNINSIADAILDLTGQPLAGTRSREIAVKYFSQQAIFPKWLELYEDVSGLS
jgi:glycosyltransferase involved in cell wall biosynthesis